MKKLIVTLNSFAITVLGVSTVIACNNGKSDNTTNKTLDELLNAEFSVISKKEIDDFKDKLIIELQKQINIITADNINILKSDGTELSSEHYLTEPLITVKLKAKGAKFRGEKLITVNWTEEKDLGKLLADTVTVKSKQNVGYFIAELLYQLKKQLWSISKDNVSILKSDDSAINSDEFTVNFSVKIVPKGDYFKGEKIIAITWTEDIRDLDRILSDTVVVTSKKDLADFEEKLLIELGHQHFWFSNYTINFFKTDGVTPLNSDEFTASFSVKVLPKGGYFEGEKVITVKWNLETRLDILLADTVIVTSQKDPEDFKNKLVEVLKENASTITADDIELFNEGNKKLDKDTLKEGNIKIKIKAKTVNFEGEKNVIIN